MSKEYNQLSVVLLLENPRKQSFLERTFLKTCEWEHLIIS